MSLKSFQVKLGDFYEVRGIITQGVDQGQIDIINSNGRIWTKTFSVKYMASNDEFKDIVDSKGVIKIFDGNYDIKFRVKNYQDKQNLLINFYYPLKVSSGKYVPTSPHHNSSESIPEIDQKRPSRTSYGVYWL